MLQALQTQLPALNGAHRSRNPDPGPRLEQGVLLDGEDDDREEEEERPRQPRPGRHVVDNLIEILRHRPGGIDSRELAQRLGLESGKSLSFLRQAIGRRARAQGIELTDVIRLERRARRRFWLPGPKIDRLEVPA